MGDPKTYYASLPVGERLEYAKHNLKMMIFAVDTRPNGFDHGGIMALVENWLLFGKNVRGSGYPATVQHMWTRRQKARPTPNGLKRTQHLVATLKRLNNFLNPGERNLEGFYELFTDAQTQMFELVSEFRSRMEEMKHKDLTRLMAELQHMTQRVKMRTY